MPPRDVPLPQLATMVDELGEKYIKSLLRLAQRGAWLEYRDSAIFPGARFRFTKNARQPMGFSYRSRRWNRRKHDLPDYVFTGRFRDSVLNRNPKTTVTDNVVSTKFSIFGGAMNLLSAKSGSMNAAEGKGLVQRTAHQRRSRTGKMVSVRAYSQRGFTRGAPSGRSYAEEWGYRPDEIAWVGRRTDQLGTALYNATAFNKKGNLRTNLRVTKANLKALIGV